MEGRGAELQQPAGDRKAVALDHLVLGGNGERCPEIDQAMQEIIGQVVAVDDVDGGADEVGFDKLLPAARRLGRTAPLMHRCDQVEFSRQAEVVHRDVERRVVWAENRKTEGYQAVPVGKRPRPAAVRPRAAGAELRKNAVRPVSAPA